MALNFIASQIDRLADVPEGQALWRKVRSAVCRTEGGPRSDLRPARNLATLVSYAETRRLEARLRLLQSTNRLMAQFAGSGTSSILSEQPIKIGRQPNAALL